MIKHEELKKKNIKDPKAFIEYPNNTNDVFKSIKD